MKPLEKLNNVELAKLLHQLFPQEIKAFLLYSKNVAEILIENQHENKENWQNGLFTFEFWLNLATDTIGKINKYGTKLETNAGLFSDQLFDGHNAFFMIHCLINFTTIRKSANEKFNKAVDLLFN